MEPIKEVTVVIVGAGPAGLATSACLNYARVSNIVLERENVCASLWKNRAYDRLKLHLGKEFCNLPHMPFPSDWPRFIPRKDFVNYLDNYTSSFNIEPYYMRTVLSASYDPTYEKWHIVARNDSSKGQGCETYCAKFLVVATGENSEGVIPNVPGLNGFSGEWMHSNAYTNGQMFAGKDVLVVGCGNSGMEIAYDLWNYGANTSIVIRSPVHVLTKDIVYLGMKLLKYLPTFIVDEIVVLFSKLKFRNMAKNYGIERPKQGPFSFKEATGRTPTIDVGAMDKIKEGKITVLPAMTKIEDDIVKFEDGKTARFDAIIFACGYRSTVWNWLKGGEDLFNPKGMPRGRFPNHWKGKNGLYGVGFAGRGLAGISRDAMNIANDIVSSFTSKY
ncbi:probable indole-3-pyruvate monooxygenase YUCCA11 [Punica granatum]|uniref:Flavin-containing monooxygenase n=2 Tax=Punica granatum TaxID=22663 RepID=A0A218WVW3_PUNGR|nr:probable indole-3-pyruvate monooxygenase YUCCA11 [Punica granatum]OWM76977.1 hypothetical protein CDL15_Pgr011702 [Punica granatum]PKI60675.1 hypothetical protein CRG98_018922 [Punica granatum]